MRRFVLAMCMLLLASLSNAQMFWSDDFSKPQHWYEQCIVGGVHWTIGTQSNKYMDAFASQSFMNGFAQFNSSASKEMQYAHLICRNAIKFDKTKQIRLSFWYQYVNYDDSIFVWLIAPNAKSKSDSLIIRVAPDLTRENSTLNPMLFDEEITSFTQQHDSAYFGFSFYSNDGNGYAWMIDDIVFRNVPQSDAEVRSVFAIAEVPLHQAKKQLLSAVIKNNGLKSLNNVSVTLVVEGATKFTDSQIITILKPDSVMRVYFKPYQPSDTGQNNITVRIDGADDDVSNNQLYVKQHVSGNSYSLSVQNNKVVPFGLFYDKGSVFMTKFYAADSAHITAIDVPLSEDEASINNKVYVVLYDSLKRIVDSTQIITIQASDLGTIQHLRFNKQLLFHETYFYVGLAQPASVTVYQPFTAVVDQLDWRYNTFGISNLSGSQSFSYSLNLLPQFSLKFGMPTPEIGLVSYKDSADRNFIAWNRPTFRAGIRSYKVWRKNASNAFDLIGIKAWNELTFCLDSTANPNSKDCYYALCTIDTLGNESEKSAIHRTIRFVYNKGSEPPSVTWNRYEGKAFQTYRIFARNAKGVNEKIDEFASNGNETQTYQIPDKYRNYSKFWVSAVFADSISPTKLKTDTGPFSQSFSNMSEISLVYTNEFIRSEKLIVEQCLGNVLKINIQDGDCDCDFAIVSSVGATMFSATLHKSEVQNVEIGNLSNGTYFVVALCNSTVIVHQFIKR